MFQKKNLEMKQGGSDRVSMSGRASWSYHSGPFFQKQDNRVTDVVKKRKVRHDQVVSKQRTGIKKTHKIVGPCSE